jgi:SAM-dependent methyltransferase
MEPFMVEFVQRLDVSLEHEVLEVAAGSGALTQALAGRVKSLLATDFAPAMIEVLRERMVGATNVSYAVMDGQALELEDNRFDRAASSFGMMLFPDRAQGFAELRRVLRPGGKAMISGWAGPDRFGAFSLFIEALSQAFPDMPPPPTPPVFSLADPAKFKAELEAVGFTDVKVDFVERDLELPNFDAVWDMLTAGAPPAKMLFDRLGPGGKERVHEVLAKIVKERFGYGPVRTTNAATVGVGRVN